MKMTPAASSADLSYAQDLANCSYSRADLLVYGLSSAGALSADISNSFSKLAHD